MLVSSLLLAVAAASALAHHGRRSGWPRAALLLALLIGGSGVLFEALSGGAQSSWLATALVAVGFALLYQGEPFPGGRAAEIYPGERQALNVLQALLCLTIATLFEPVCLVLFAAVLEPARRSGRRPVLFLAAVLPLALLAWKVIRPLVAAGADAFPMSTRLLDPALGLWNLAYLFAGRNVGLVVWYLPAALLVACYRPGTGRGWLLASVAAGALLMPLVRPHNFWGGPEAVGNAVALPLFAALWYLPKQVPRARWLALVAIAAGLFLWPAWRAPLATARGDDRPANHEGSAASRLLYETTQEHAPAETEWQGTGVLSRSLGPGLADTDAGPALVPEAGAAELMIASARPLEAVLLDFGPRAGSELVVGGGEVGNTVLQPDGGIRFEVLVDAPDRRHPLWLDAKPYHVYLLRIEMPEAPERPLPVAIMARPVEALPRALDPSSLDEADG